MNKPSPFKTVSSRIAYQNHWLKVREDQIVRPDGSDGIYGVIESNDSVICVVVDDQQRICFVNVFRYPAQQWKWELPGGGGDGEAVLEASKRELEEEVGIVADELHVLGKTRVCNGFMTELQTTVLATDLHHTRATDTEEGIEEHSFLSLDEIDSAIDKGEIDDGQSLAALYLYKRRLDKNDKSV